MNTNAAIALFPDLVRQIDEAKEQHQRCKLRLQVVNQRIR